jgi:hypothetical protein
MPGSLILTLLSFVASHLVILTLAAFVVVGAALSGLIELPGIANSDPARQQGTAPSLPDPGPVAQPRPDAASEPAVRPAARPAPKSPSSRPQPPMIGGTLPNYASGGDGFRPPNAAAPPPGSAPASRDALVQAARRSFWNGDFEAAEAAYVTAISRYPEDPDLFGELGNLYQSMGEHARSLDAYFAAGQRLRAMGERDKLSQVIDLLDSQGYSDTVRLRP